MMYGFGDEPPLDETLDLVEDIVIEYATGLLHRAVDAAAERGRVRVGGRLAPGALAPEDLLALVRGDRRKAGRAAELLEMQGDMLRARQVFDPRDTGLAAVTAAAAAAAAPGEGAGGAGGAGEEGGGAGGEEGGGAGEEAGGAGEEAAGAEDA